MQKFEDATAKSEDERAKLSCYANSFRIRNFKFSHLQTKGGPSGHHQHLTSYSYSHAKNSAIWWRGAQNVGALFFFFSIYTNLLMFIFMDLLTHVYIHMIKKIILKKKVENFLKFFFYYFAYIFIFGVQVLTNTKKYVRNKFCK